MARLEWGRASAAARARAGARARGRPPFLRSNACACASVARGTRHAAKYRPASGAGDAQARREAAFKEMDAHAEMALEGAERDRGRSDRTASTSLKAAGKWLGAIAASCSTLSTL
eukprot:6176045-Pleurochrysis_carterae.AAC.2